MEKSMLEQEISMTKFLSVFFGVNPNKSKNMTHEDAKQLLSYLESFSDYEFWKKHDINDLIDYVKVKDKNDKVKYYKKPEVELSPVTEMEECSLKHFLSCYFGVDPSLSRQMIHSDAVCMFEELKYVTEEQLVNIPSVQQNLNYIKVTDKDKKVLYYDKTSIFVTDEDFDLQYLILQYEELDLSELKKWELCELRKKLKLIKKYNNNVLDRQISNVSKCLRKIKRREKNEKY